MPAAPQAPLCALMLGKPCKRIGLISIRAEAVLNSVQKRFALKSCEHGWPQHRKSTTENSKGRFASGVQTTAHEERHLQVLCGRPCVDDSVGGSIIGLPAGPQQPRHRRKQDARSHWPGSSKHSQLPSAADLRSEYLAEPVWAPAWPGVHPASASQHAHLYEATRNGGAKQGAPPRACRIPLACKTHAMAGKRACCSRCSTAMQSSTAAMSHLARTTAACVLGQAGRVLATLRACKLQVLLHGKVYDLGLRDAPATWCPMKQTCCQVAGGLSGPAAPGRHAPSR